MAGIRLLCLITAGGVLDLINSIKSYTEIKAIRMFSKFQILDAVNAVKNPFSKIKESIKDMIKGEQI